MGMERHILIGNFISHAYTYIHTYAYMYVLCTCVHVFKAFSIHSQLMKYSAKAIECANHVGIILGIQYELHNGFRQPMLST